MLLQIPHIQQIHDGECLAACAAMVLQYLDWPMPYHRLVHLLEIYPNYGTPFSKIQRLENKRISVEYRQGNLQQLTQLLEDGLPSIVQVNTGELPYWSYASPHVIVVVGIDDNFVHVNDPAISTAPITVPKGDFDLAWFEGFERYAILRVR